jgi:hypothetical protein
MPDQEPPAAELSPKRLHPLPGFCWMWPAGGFFLLLIGGLMLWFCIDPPEEALAEYPRSNPRWKELIFIGSAGVITGGAYLWFWYRFAVKRVLTRNSWHVGVGLILTGAAFLLLTGWIITGVIYLLTLAIWAQGLTRKHFDES